jgi:hypothetical protein
MGYAPSPPTATASANGSSASTPPRTACRSGEELGEGQPKARHHLFPVEHTLREDEHRRLIGPEDGGGPRLRVDQPDSGTPASM